MKNSRSWTGKKYSNSCNTNSTDIKRSSFLSVYRRLGGIGNRHAIEFLETT
ncbi:MAG: hypothetical protein ACE5I1_04970 [bacterium]